jgi:segregation and condensation protein B
MAPEAATADEVAPGPDPAPAGEADPEVDAGPGTVRGAGPAPVPAPTGEARPGADAGADAAGEGDPEGDPNAWPPDEVLEAVELDDRGWVRRDLEAILLVADEPVPATTLAELVGARLSEVEELLVELAGEYARDGRGFVLRAIAGGWRLYTHPGARTAVEAFLQAGQQSRLTRAALETLAVIAYRQPVTRFQVAAVRGVNVDGVFRTLLSRGLIQEVGTDSGPGQATLYGTTPAFLEQLGLNSLDQLPPIKDYLPDGVDLVELQEQP